MAKVRLTLLPLVSLLILASTACDDLGPAAEGTFERSLKVSGITDLEVTTGSGDIRIRTGDGATVRVHGKVRARTGRGASAEEKLEYLTRTPPIEQFGSSIRIGRVEDERYTRNVSISYELEVPAETRVRSRTGSGGLFVEGLSRSVEASTGSGDLRIARIAGDVRSSTGSGSVELDTVRGRIEATTGSGDIRAFGVAGGFSGKTGSGSVELDQVAAGDVTLSTGSGNLKATGVQGELRAQTGSGDISVQGIPTGVWNLRASSGGVTLRLGNDAGFDLDARTDAGQVTVNHPVTVVGSVSPKAMRGKVRGGGAAVEVRSGSGDIRIE